ncbi:polysaccharide deacetylase family protein [Paenibacillus sp. JSM ZJ436]|uniref:polysaccharide deacetylase family protein n=1 Tax=Paenibacillus sp. JSM ZJ436 TaxID=3376190 RepID=UPI00378A35A2
MQEMYPASVNSVATELATDINATQTTITLVNASVIPDAPNLLTIGGGNNAETIRYGGKSGNQLTDVTRGFQGTAQSWNAGTAAARYFTAYDADAARENIASVSAEASYAVKRAVETVSHNVDKSVIVSFVDDDGHPNVYTSLRPIFQNADSPLTCAIITGNYTGELDWSHMSLEQLQELKKIGWEICNHTVTHPYLANVPRDQLEYEIKSSSEFLNAHGFDGDILIYPYGSQNELVRRITRKYSILGVGGYNEYNKMPIETYVLSRFGNIAPINPEDFNFDLEECKRIVDNAPNETWIIFYTHAKNRKWTETENQQKLSDLIAYIKSKNYEIVTLRDGLSRKGNIVDSGDKLTTGKYFKIGRDGTFEEGYSWFDDTITSTSPPSAYPKGESTLALTYAEATEKGFPNEAGQLKTYRVKKSNFSNDEIYTYQEWYSNYNNTVLRRRWDDSNKVWFPFAKVQYENVISSVNPYLASDGITKFPPHSITTFRFDSNNTTGFPFSAGTVTTYRLDSNGYSRQEVNQHNGFEQAVRIPLTSSSWSEWFMENPSTTKIISMSNTNWRLVSPKKVIECVDFTRFLMLQGQSVALIKNVWLKSEISTNINAPTIVGNFTNGNLTCYQDASGLLYIKFDTTGNNYKAYVNVMIV